MEIVLARIRTIKPEFFTSTDIVDLSPLARLLYIALWCEADREGRLVWNTRTFKMRYLPADSCDIESLSEELLRAGVVVQYGDGYAVIPSFLRHQHINPRESVSVLPDPDDENDASFTRHPRVSDAQVGMGRKGKEGKGKEGDIDGAIAPVAVAPKKPKPGLGVEFLVSQGCEESHAADWLKVRKAKRAPLTETAWDDLRREASKAGVTPSEAVRICASRSWQGFKSEWLTKDQGGAETPYQRSMREKYEQVCPAIAAKAPTAYPAPVVFDFEVIDAKQATPPRLG